MKINENQCQGQGVNAKIIENQWKSMKINARAKAPGAGQGQGQGLGQGLGQGQGQGWGQGIEGIE